MTSSVHIVGVGARTPLGLTAESSIAAVNAGISQVTEHPVYIDRMAEPVRLAQDTILHPELAGPRRLIEMATTALEEVCSELETHQSGINNIPLLVCLPEERPGWTRGDAESVIRGLGMLHLPITFQPIKGVSLGHAAGSVALDIACSEIRADQAELYVILGVDSYSEYETLSWLDESRQLATSYHRGGFFPGEGAAALVVASDSVVRRFGFDSLAVVKEVSLAKEANLIKTDAICLGEGLTECVRKVLVNLHLPDEAIEGIICDINGERYRSEEWGFTILRLPNAFLDPTGYELPSACWGDVGAASGPLFMALASIAGKKGWASGRRYLIWNSSEAGLRTAALLILNPQRD